MSGVRKNGTSPQGEPKKVKYVRLPGGDGFLDDGKECLPDDGITDQEGRDQESDENSGDKSEEAGELQK